MADRSPQIQDKYILRFPDGMREQLKEEAKKTGRSLNAEVVHRLANSLSFPRFEDFGFDFGFGFDEELNFNLMSAASMSGRSLMEEIVYRLGQSLKTENTLIYELERQAWAARRDLDKLARLFLQMTPEERRILEERAEICENASEWKVSSKEIAELTSTKRIGGGEG